MSVESKVKMSKRDNMGMFIATMLILIVAICPMLLMVWLTAKLDMPLALVLWFIIFLVVSLSSWGSYYYKKIVGVQYAGRGGGVIGVIVSSVIVSVLLGLVYLFRLAF